MSKGIILGAMNFGTTTDEETSLAILDRFVERGGSWIDTANCYAFWNSETRAGGQSETVLGHWFATRPGVRDEVKIATKVRQEPTVPGQWPSSAEGLSKQAIDSALDASLKRLGIESVDLYWAHAQDTSVELTETVTALAALVADGRVAKLGASNHAIWRVECARRIAADAGVAGFDALQLRHSYLSPRPSLTLIDSSQQIQVTAETVDYLSARPGIDLWAYSPLLGGAYVKPERLDQRWNHPGTTARLARLDQVSKELGATFNQVVLAWLLQSNPVAQPIVGVSSLSQLDEALDVVTLSDEHHAWLSEPE